MQPNNTNGTLPSNLPDDSTSNAGQGQAVPPQEPARTGPLMPPGWVGPFPEPIFIEVDGPDDEDEATAPTPPQAPEQPAYNPLYAAPASTEETVIPLHEGAGASTVITPSIPPSELPQNITPTQPPEPPVTPL